MTHDFIAETVAFVVWEQHATTRLVALRRRNTNVRNLVTAMRKLVDQLQSHFGLTAREHVISLLLAAPPGGSIRGATLGPAPTA